MYWRVASFQHASPLESLLDKEVVTVEELLDEDELIQETRGLNPKVISFLSQPSSIEVPVTLSHSHAKLPCPSLTNDCNDAGGQPKYINAGQFQDGVHDQILVAPLQD